MTTRWMDSPLGGLRLRASGGRLAAVDLDAEPLGRPVPDPLLDDAQRQLTEYFAGERSSFDLPLSESGSDFQQLVWAEVQRIPFGQTASYGDIARRLGLGPEAARAVGLANGQNPLLIVVPCHRVVGADGSLTGYAGGVARKQALLEREIPGLV